MRNSWSLSTNSTSGTSRRHKPPRRSGRLVEAGDPACRHREPRPLDLLERNRLVGHHRVGLRGRCDVRRRSGPVVSSDHASGTTPVASMLPSAGLKPTTPHSAAGMRIEPPVSVPIAHSHIPAATATADPPDDPPGHPARVVRIQNRPVMRVHAGHAESELVKVGLTHDDAALGPDRRDHRRILARPARSGRMTPPAVVTMPATSTRSLTATTVPAPSSAEVEMKA